MRWLLLLFIMVASFELGAFFSIYMIKDKINVEILIALSAALVLSITLLKVNRKWEK